MSAPQHTRNRAGRVCLAVAASLLAIPTSLAAAAPGDPDPSFSGDGRVTHGLGQTTVQLRDIGEDAARQTDGKIVIAGLSGEDGSGPALVTRLNADGSLDTGFSTDGFAPIDLPNSTATAVAIQSDGEIVVAGSTFSPSGSQDGFVARLESNGTLDGGFNGDGIATFDAGGGAFETFSDLTIAADGDAIAGGNTFTPGPTPPAGLVVRFDGATGNPDAGFGGGDGIVTTTDVSPFVNSIAVAAQGNDVILAGPSSGQTKVLRLLANGSADPTFGTGGSTTLNFGSGSQGPATNGLAIAPSGMIVIGARVFGSGEDFGIARLTAGGAPDTGFAGDGTVTSDLGAGDELRGIAVQADDSVLAVGRTGTSPQFADADFAIARYTPAGVLDSSFDGDGFAVTDVGAADTAAAVTIDPGVLPGVTSDDHAIVAGTKGTLQSGADLAAARYATATGTLDATFGNSGLAVHGRELVRNSNDVGLGVAVQDDGKVVVAGNTDVPDGNADFAVTRFNADGTVDTGFAGDGTAEVDFSGGSDSANDVAVLDDGSIVAFGGTVDQGSGAGDLALARLTSGGTLDPSFGTGGRKTVDIGSSMGPEIPGGLAVQSDGKLVLSGNFNSMSGSGIAAVRLTASGAEDASFDTDGIAPLTVAGAFLQASSVAIQADGKVVVGGGLQVFTPSFGADAAVARFTDTGAPDTSFGGDGVATIDVGPSTFEATNDVVIASDGDIVTVGGSNPTGSDGEIGFASFDDADGSPDAGFGSGGQLTLTSPGEDFGSGIALQADGKLVASGGDGGDFASIRLSAAGVPDTSYGPGGRRTLDLGAADNAAEIAVMGDGRLVLAGSSSDGETSDIAAARLLGDEVDEDADDDGIANSVDTNPGTPSDGFDDGDGTAVSITDRGGLPMTIEDSSAAAPYDGVHVVVGGASGQATYRCLRLHARPRGRHRRDNHLREHDRQRGSG